ncbi:SulP family inorganic anion transporter [Clostridium gasigenes]|uniref:SulP family inorganic anion transporter n=1 Tax=Clostridium gasigenes TaxID=94869 RepID=UPI0014383402|nr:SulP family inorganic anion transporter [Clostridium gasigenes]NKF08693.1 SulP family inorganic anion transporter [Clostridium gasigenes]QSW21208.1 SulP family inorganic anion transporter [Clostridium gasigenes]
MNNLREEWFGNVKGDLLAGIVVCMALIPEAIGFSIVAGVDPMVGVYSSFCISLIISIFGGRTGMISAAAGEMALVLASLVKSHGIEYMLAATILTGVFQLILEFLKIGNLLKFIPKPVMIGFVNALGIMMFQSQLNHFKGSFVLILLGALGIAVIYLLPKLTKAIPSPIVSIMTVTLIVVIFKIDVTTLGDMGRITSDLPKFLIPTIPFNMETLSIILPYSLSLSLVGIVESLLTAQLVDDLTDTKSNKNKECVGQGLANIAAGFFGGIAGCGMIGQTIINQNYGGKGRLSTLTAGTSMLISVIVLNKFVVQIPVVALGAVMVVVSISTFNFESIKRIAKVPKADTFVMISTVIVVVLTHNLAYGVIVGIILSSIFFASKISDIQVNLATNESDIVTYEVKGQLFFASTLKFIHSFNYTEKIDLVNIDLSHVKVWDESAVDAIDKVVIKFHKNGVKTNLLGMRPECLALIDKIAIYNKPGGLEVVSEH